MRLLVKLKLSTLWMYIPYRVELQIKLKVMLMLLETDIYRQVLSQSWREEFIINDFLGLGI